MTLTLLDGGMGQELVARAGKATSLWSVQALLDNPETVRAVHRSYFNAGADVAPDLRLTSIDGERVALSDYLGQPVAVMFMHSY
mgnify:CR=1 FL=1